MSAAQNESAAWPKAEDPALVQELLDCVQQASHYRQLKKGAVRLSLVLSLSSGHWLIEPQNEATKSYV